MIERRSYEDARADLDKLIAEYRKATAENGFSEDRRSEAIANIRKLGFPADAEARWLDAKRKGRFS